MSYVDKNQTQNGQLLNVTSQQHHLIVIHWLSKSTVLLLTGLHENLAFTNCQKGKREMRSVFFFCPLQARLWLNTVWLPPLW